MASRAERRVDRRRRRRRVGALGAALCIAAAGAAGFLLSGGEERRVAQAAPTSTTTTTAPFVPVTTLTSNVGELAVFEAPDEAAAEVTRLTNPTRYGLPLTLLATNTAPGWHEALLPIRPNGSTGWVRAADVTTGTSDYEIRVSLAAHRLQLLEGGEPVLESPVVLGKPETPTPPGRFYVTDPVDLTSRPGSAYGAFALGISGFSEVLLEFNGGPGQLAVHGTPHPEQVGQDISNGCVRVPDDVIVQIAELVPLGTPVVIEA